ncbi:MAG: hypothetical protein HY329_14070, partial [Chloroflexi bacterium]|nr:hypothetical protein [Chloroflexota bacterium]
IAPDPATGSLYVGTFEHGVFRSDDRGQSWQPAGPMLRTYARVESLAVGAVGGAPRVIALGRVGSNSFVFLLAEPSSLKVTSRLLLPIVRH